MKVSVIVPTLNEVGSIAKTLSDVAKEDVDEILVVDGHSTDGTAELVKKAGHRIILQKKEGLGNAVKEGIENTEGDIVIIVDADGSHNTTDISMLVQKIHKGYDLVVASRYISGPRIKGILFSDRQSSSYDDTFIRAIGNRFFTYLCQKIYHLEIHDVLMGFKAFRRSIFKKIKLNESGQQFDAEIIIKAKKAGFRIGEVPTPEHKRVYGKSKLSVPYHGFKVLWVIIREMFI